MLSLKNIRRAVCLIVVCAVLCAAFISFISCGNQGAVAMTLTYGKNTTTISSNIYSYYLSHTKTMALAEFYSMYGGFSPQEIVNMGDFPDYWAMQASETDTVGDRVKIQAEMILRQFLAIAAYCKEHKLDISKETKSKIDTSVKELIDSAKYKRSKNALNSVLIRFDIDDKILKEIRRLEELTGVFAKHALPEGSGRQLSEEMINFAYDDMCSRVKHILIRYTPGEIDDETQAKVDDLYDRIMNGEDFDSLLSESADGMPFEGYTVRSDTNFVPEFLNAALEMAVGEVRKVESDYGMHIIKRFELLPAEQAINIGTGESWRTTIGQELQRELRFMDMMDVLEPYMSAIEINTAETDLFDIASSAIMFDCMEIMQ